jgi:hypothetical protein
MKPVKQLGLFLENRSATLPDLRQRKNCERRTMTLKTDGKLVI